MRLGSLHSRPFTAAVAFFPFIRSDREVDLPFEGINPHNEDTYLVADPESFTRSPANELPASRLE